MGVNSQYGIIFTLLWAADDEPAAEDKPVPPPLARRASNKIGNGIDWVRTRIKGNKNYLIFQLISYINSEDAGKSMAGLRKSLTQFQKVNKEKPEDKDSELSIKLTKLALQIGKAGNWQN